MNLIDKLEMALASRELAEKLISCLKSGNSEGLDETHLSSALSNSKLAKEVIEAVGSNLKHLDLELLSIALGSSEIASELIMIEKEAEAKSIVKEEPKKEEPKKEVKQEPRKEAKKEKSKKTKVSKSK